MKVALALHRMGLKGSLMQHSLGVGSILAAPRFGAAPRQSQIMISRHGLNA